jgi:RNA polymerase sigma-70 factor (ECF subfamily)
MAHSEDSPSVPAEAAGEVYSDHSLLQRLRAGSEDAATQLYLRYAGRLRGVIRAECSHDLTRRVDADDLVQSVFTCFFHGVSRGAYDVPAGEELWKLFLVLALNKIRAKGAYHRAAKRDVRLTAGPEGIEQAAKAGQGADPTDLAFLKMVVDETLERLPPLQRQMITLRIEGYEVAEIAAQTQRSKRTVERVLQAFRRQLGDVLHGED